MVRTFIVGTRTLLEMTGSNLVDRTTICKGNRFESEFEKGKSEWLKERQAIKNKHS